MNRGKLTILAILGVAVAMAIWAWCHRYLQGDAVMKRWDSEAVRLIRHAPQTELLVLEEQQQDPGQVLVIGPDKVWITNSQDITDRPGLIHARHALIEDASYRWESIPQCVGRWRFALRFSDGAGKRATLAFNPECDRVTLVEKGETLLIRKSLMNSYVQRFLQPEPETDQQARSP